MAFGYDFNDSPQNPQCINKVGRAAIKAECLSRKTDPEPKAFSYPVLFMFFFLSDSRLEGLMSLFIPNSQPVWSLRAIKPNFPWGFFRTAGINPNYSSAHGKYSTEFEVDEVHLRFHFKCAAVVSSQILHADASSLVCADAVVD